MPSRYFGNRRKTVRKPIKGLAVISDPFAGFMVKGVIADLSLSGVGIRVMSTEIDKYFQTTVFMLHLLIPSWGEPIVCYVTFDRLVPLKVGKLIGMKFVTISDESLQLIRQKLIE